MAKYFSVKEHLVTYAGLKDRFAVTEQWFGVHVPGKEEYDLSNLNIEGVAMISFARHNKKLRIGALTGNKFQLTLRNVTQLDDLKMRWNNILAGGVPNYFGEQRFGIDGGNIEKANELFSGRKIKDKKKRGIYLSAARSYLFNDVVSQRITQQYFDVISVGDVCMLAGTQSIFLVDELDNTLDTRLKENDIDLTGPLWGAGDLMTKAEPLIFEQLIAKNHAEIVEGLPRFGLKQERRRIRLSISQASMDVETSAMADIDKTTVVLSFFLPAGCYATTILRELLDYQDLTERVNPQ